MIEFNGVTKEFKNFLALDNISLKIPKGSAFGLLGSNGAGKSTILRIIAGIYEIDNGYTTIDGDIIYDNYKTKEKVFFINDETVQYQKYNLKELKKLYKAFYPNFSEEVFEKLNKKINLPLNKKIGDFSKGMKRQSIVIIGLACMTEYLLLDEAFDGLDPTMRIIVKNMIFDAMFDRKLTVVISSHNLKEINEICDTAALLHKGKILFNRDLDDIRGNVHKVQVAFENNYTKEDFEELDIMHFEKQASITFMIIKGSQEKINEVISKKLPKVFDTIPLSLEEIFIYEMEGQGYDFKDINE